MTTAKNKLSKIILALDYSDSATALELVGKLEPKDCRLKVGLELYTVAGNKFVRELVERGFDVFLDLKFHDIPNTVSRTCSVVAELGVWMINVHTLGGTAMMLAARKSVDDSRHQPLLTGVTVLTSQNKDEMSSIGIVGELTSVVSRLASMAKQAGLDGVVCSPLETSRLRKELGENFTLVTPGIRPKGNNRDDQQRVMTPEEAVASGSDFLVIGRPVTQSADPVETLKILNNSLLSHPPA